MKKALVLLSILLIAHLLLLANLQFTAWPEMLSYPYLYNNDFSLYKDIIHPYPPLLTGLLAVWYGWFGYGLGSMKVFTWIIILVNDFLIYFIARKLTKNDLLPVISVFVYVFLQPFLEGNMLWFDLALVPFVLAGVFFSINVFRSKKVAWFDLVLSGYFFTLAALIKQTAGIYLLIFLGFLWFFKRNIKYLKHALVAPFFIGAILILKLAAEDTLLWFLNWLFIYPMTQWSNFPGYVQMTMTGTQTLIIVLLIAPFVLGIKTFTNKANRSEKVFLLAFVLASFLSIYPRFSFFHFQMGIALISIGLVLQLSKAKDVSKFGIVLIFFLIPYVHKPVLNLYWRKEARFYSSQEKRVSEIIQKLTNKGEKVYFLGMHSGLYVFSDRLPPEPWTDNFGWYLEIDEVQRSILERWDSNPPKYVVWNDPKKGNWYDLGTYQPNMITDWVKNNYYKTDSIQKGVVLWQRKD